MPRVARSTARRRVPRRAVPVRRYATRGYGGYSKPALTSRSVIPVTRYSVRGRGGYWDNVKARWKQGGGTMKSAFEDAGRTLAGPVGGPVGGLFNRALYALTGFGDYHVKSNVLMETNGPPAVVNRSNKEFVVRHREYITDIYSLAGTANTPSAFGVTSYSINPGNASTFPWLSTIADKFEQYRIEGMVFEYKSLYSDAVVTQNGSIGSIVLATEYNAGAPSFATKQQMENYQFAQSCKPSLSVLHPVECARSQNVLSELYVRTGAVPANEDVKTYDFGDFQIASQGIPIGASGAAVNLGELWVSYQIALIKPKIVTNYVDSGFAYFSTNGNNDPVTGWGTNPCPTSLIQRRDISNMDVQLISDNVFQIRCSSTIRNYQLDLYWYSFTTSAGAVWRGPACSITNGTIVNTTTSGSYQQIRQPLGLQVAERCQSHLFITVPAATPSQTTCLVTVQTATFGCDQTAAVRFEGFFNAVPYPLS